jgi:Zn-dependent protease with chaperone function
MYTDRRRALVSGLIALSLLSGCELVPAPPPDQGSTPSQGGRQTAQHASGGAVDPAVVARLKGVMVPLLQHMDHPIPPSQVRVGILDDPQINAANGGGGEFYVTLGLLQKSNDDQLRAVMAHEIAHADLGHVAKQQRVNTGLQVGMVLLEQVFPKAQALAPVAAQLVANAYTRQEEYQADSHGVELLNRTGANGKTLMVQTLTWLMETEGSSGGFFATHPATGDRIQAVQQLPG